MSEPLNPTEFDKFLAELDSDAYATDMGFMDLLGPIGFGDGYVGDGGLGPAASMDAGDRLSGMDYVSLSIDIEEKTHDTYPGPQDPISPLLHDNDSSVKVTPSSEYTCLVCGEHGVSEWILESHARCKKHKTLRCNAAGCDERFITAAERNAHQRRPHLEGHRRLKTSHPDYCVECRKEFSSRAKLQQHAIEAQHTPFACVCGQGFARLDVLHRHLDSLGNVMPKYPCSYCKKHRGKNGFKRRDHLLQHIRGYHKFEAKEKLGGVLPSRRGKYGIPPVCPYPECKSHRGDSFKDLSPEEQRSKKPFETQAEYTKHMKEAHDFTPFPCNVAGCIKTGKKGYTREKDLINHRKKEHPEAGPYVPKPGDIRIAWRFPGCGALLGPNSVQCHLHGGMSWF